MTPEQKAQLEREVAAADKAQRAYDLFLRIYINTQKTMIVDEFANTDLSADFQALKYKLSAVMELEDNILTVIETGRMAVNQLGNEPD